METEKLTFHSLASATDAEAGSGAGPPKPWRRGICDCCSNVGVCCLTTWCNPILTAQAVSVAMGGSGVWCLVTFFVIFGLTSVGGALSGITGEAGPAVGASLASLASVFSCVVLIMARGAMRRRYNLEGSSMCDFWLSWCCAPCSVVQIFSQREVVACCGEGTRYEGLCSTYAEEV